MLLAVTLLATLPAIGVSVTDLARALLPAGTACGTMALAVWLLDHRVLALPAALQLVALALAGAATYVGSLWLGWPDLVRETWAMLRKPRQQGA